MHRTLARTLLLSLLLTGCHGAHDAERTATTPTATAASGSAAGPAEPIAARPSPATAPAQAEGAPGRAVPDAPTDGERDLRAMDKGEAKDGAAGARGPAPAGKMTTRRGAAAARAAELAGEPAGGDAPAPARANGWVDARRDHLSTFAADVDTASYTLARRALTEGLRPSPAAVRVEEFVNYFRFAYPSPAAGQPFSVTMDAAPSPLAPGRQVVRVGVATRPLARSERRPANLVFLVDVSGSMDAPDKLPLARRALRVLVDNLGDEDTVALVTYAGSTRVVLPPTRLAHRDRILAALEELHAGGSTAMADGLALAYAQATQGLRPGATSRVIVLSDGDANVGQTGHAAILATIAGEVKRGVTLSTIGFGMGNYRDALMEQLADRGNGNNFYIDTISQARRVFQEQLGATLQVVAKDVKLQVDFDPRVVARYRLIGYENRDVADDDFRDDKVDAGEIGAGHQVTAVYEVEPAAGAPADAPLGVVRVRHKAPDGATATEAAFPMAREARAARFEQASADLRFAFAAAAFADVLRGAPDAASWDLAAIRGLAEAAAGQDRDRRELVGLIDRARELGRGRGATTAALATDAR